MIIFVLSWNFFCVLVGGATGATGAAPAAAGAFAAGTAGAAGAAPAAAGAFAAGTAGTAPAAAATCGLIGVAGGAAPAGCDSPNNDIFDNLDYQLLDEINDLSELLEII